MEKLARQVGSITVAKALNHQLRQQIRYKFKKEDDPEDVDIVGSDLNAAVKAVSKFFDVKHELDQVDLSL